MTAGAAAAYAQRRRRSAPAGGSPAPGGAVAESAQNWHTRVGSSRVASVVRVEGAATTLEGGGRARVCLEGGSRIWAVLRLKRQTRARAGWLGLRDWENDPFPVE